MAALLSRRAVVALKVEAVEGTAESVAVGDATNLVYDPEFSPDISLFDRDPARPYHSHVPSVPGVKLGQISFRTELKGSGSIAAAPSWGPALRTCGFQQSTVSSINIGAVAGGPYQPGETITGGTSAATGRVVGEIATGAAAITYVVLTGVFVNAEVITGGTSGATATSGAGPAANKGFEYRPLTAAPPSATVAVYMDGVRKQLFGARGNVRFRAEVGQPVFMEFSFQGVYDAVTDTAILSPTFETAVPPVFLSATFVTHTFSAVITRFDADIRNTLTPRRSANAAKGAIAVFIGGRSPEASIDPELTLLADHDWYGKLVAGTTGRLHYKVGSAAGNIIDFACPLVQYEEVSDQDRGGIAVAGVKLGVKSATVNTGDDEILIAMI